MDAEDFIVLLGFCILIASPIILVLFITGCIAYSHTRTWQKAKLQRLRDAEFQNPLLANKGSPQQQEEEPEFLDSEDEAEYREQQAEEAESEADWNLTTGQKFRKEWKKCWGGNAKKLQRQNEKKEREERRKIAREVVREMMRLQRKKDKALKLDLELPEYKKA